jgi:Na+/H+ antiporter NhaA
MSLFIANLAFGEIPALDTAKVGILTVSVISGVAGTFVLLIRTKHRGASLPQT